MPGQPYAFNLLQQAVREGRSATNALQTYRSLGGSIRTQTWYRMYGEVKAAYAGIPGELDLPLTRRPTATETRPWTTKRARGTLQHMQVVMIHPESGTVALKPFSLVSRRPLTRQAAMTHAINVLTDNADEYGLVPIGAVYTGTYELQPES